MIPDIHREFDSQKTLSRLPSLVALRCFAAAARMENFSKAAEVLHLTHGAVSRAVRLLEDDLGVALFERRNRGVFLTEAGRRLQHAVHDGFGLIEDATRELRRAGHEAPLVLSCEPTLLMRWLIPRWPNFQARHPEAAVHLVAGGGPFAFSSGIDLAIRRNDFEWPASVHAQPLFEEKVGLVCSPGKVNAFFESTKAGPSLRRDAVRLHTRTRPQAWAAWARMRGESTRPPGKELAFDHFYFSLQAAVAGLGVAIGPWHLVCDDLASGVLTAPLGFAEDGSTYYLLSPQKSGAGRQLQLLEWLRAMTDKETATSG